MIEIIAAMDIINGQCVRLAQGDYARQKVYGTSPVSMAQQFEAAGIKRLHMVDLDGAAHGRMMNLPVLEAVAAATTLSIDYSGGIKTYTDIQQVYAAGAAMVAIGSMAIHNAALVKTWVAQGTPSKMILAADVRDRYIAVNGWQQQTTMHILDYIEEYMNAGVYQFMCTDIAKDGMQQGVSLRLYQDIITRFPAIQLIASGGVSCIDDIRQLQDIGCSAVIIGKAIYEGSITLTGLKQWVR